MVNPMIKPVKEVEQFCNRRAILSPMPSRTRSKSLKPLLLAEILNCLKLFKT